MVFKVKRPAKYVNFNLIEEFKPLHLNVVFKGKQMVISSSADSIICWASLASTHKAKSDNKPSVIEVFNFMKEPVERS